MNAWKRVFLIVLLGSMAGTTSPTPIGEESQNQRSGNGFLPTSVYSAEENQELLKLFAGLRVADVSDGMDKAGLPGIGLVDPSILPLWTDLKNSGHRFAGIAVTARDVPTQKSHAGKRTPEEFDQWEGEFYSRCSSEPFADLIRPGTALVIDDVEEVDHEEGFRRPDSCDRRLDIS